MTWFKVDDKLPGSRKLLKIPRARRTAAVGLWTLAGAWCARELTDGHIPSELIDEIGGAKQEITDLTEAGLWDPVHDGWVFHDWSDYQPSREEVLGDRQRNADRQQAFRDRRREARNASLDRYVTRDADVSHAVSNGERNALVTPSVTVPRPDPSRPVPTLEILSPGSEAQKRPTNGSEKTEPPRADVTTLCTKLADLIEGNGAKRPTVTGGWKREARLLLDSDRRPLAEALRVMAWCQSDEFWKTNVLSMPTFRAKYDQLKLKARLGTQHSRGYA